MAAYALFVTLLCALELTVGASHLRLNFRKPREPVGNCTTIGGSDLRAAHISLSEMPHSCDTPQGSKVSYAWRRLVWVLVLIGMLTGGVQASSNTAVPTFSKNVTVLGIKVETEFTATTDSGSQERVVGDVELGKLQP